MTGVGGDTGRGLRVAARGFRTWFNFGWWLGIVVIVAGLAGALWEVFVETSEHDRHLLRAQILSEVKLAFFFDAGHEIVIRHPDGGAHVDTIGRISAFEPLLDLRDRVASDARDTAQLGGGIGAGVAIAALFGLNLLGRRLRRGRRLRGGELATAGELKRRTLPWWRWALLQGREPEAAPYRIAGIPWRKEAETLHTIVSGTTGSGKTVLISDLVEQVRERGERCIVYDKMGSYTETFFDEKRDILLNPMDKRSPRWSPFFEACTDRDFDTMANALIPTQKNIADPFWIDAARQLFSRGAAVLWKQGETRNRVLVDLLLKTELRELAEAMAGTVTQSIIDPQNPKTTLSVRAMLTANIGTMDLLPDEGAAFSIREWIERDGEGSLFLTSRGDQHASIRGLISTWLEIAVNSLLSLPRSDGRRIWVILDELPTLHQLPSLEDGLSQSRQYGGCFVLGVQVFSALRDIYGRDTAESISGLCGTRVVLAAPDRDTSEWAAQSLGRVEIESLSEGVSYDTPHSGVTLSTKREERPLVLPSEVSRLENLSGYIKLPGALPVTRIRLKYKKRQRIAERFVPKADDGPGPIHGGRPQAPVTLLAADAGGTVPAADSDMPPVADMPPETAAGPVERDAAAAQDGVAEAPASADAAGIAAGETWECGHASLPEEAERAQNEAPSDAHARGTAEEPPQESPATGPAGNAAAPASGEGKSSAAMDTEAQEDEDEPPWVTF